MSSAPAKLSGMTLGPVIAAALIVGGVTGAGVALGWYGPVVAVAAAALIGLATGLRVRSARGGRHKEARPSGSGQERR